MMEDDLKKIYYKLLGDDEDTIVSVPLKDLVWSIILYTYQMWMLEKEGLVDDWVVYHSRRSELSELLLMYTDFPTGSLYKELSKLKSE